MSSTSGVVAGDGRGSGAFQRVKNAGAPPIEVFCCLNEVEKKEGDAAGDTAAAGDNLWVLVRDSSAKAAAEEPEREPEQTGGA